MACTKLGHGRQIQLDEAMAAEPYQAIVTKILSRVSKEILEIGPSRLLYMRWVAAWKSAGTLVGPPSCVG